MLPRVAFYSLSTASMRDASRRGCSYAEGGDPVLEYDFNDPVPARLDVGHVAGRRHRWASRASIMFASLSAAIASRLGACSPETST